MYQSYKNINRSKEQIQHTKNLKKQTPKISKYRTFIAQRSSMYMLPFVPLDFHPDIVMNGFKSNVKRKLKLLEEPFS